MPLHHVRRKYRYYSEPPPLREDADSSDSGDGLVPDGAPSAEKSESRKPVAHGLLTAQATRASVRSMNKVELQQSRTAFDAQLRAIGKRTRGTTTSSARIGGSSATGTAATTTPASDRSVAFPLTPTSAAGEGERTMGSMRGTAPSGASESSSSSSEPTVKMSHPSSIIHSSTRPPPPAVPVSSTSHSNTPPSHILANGSGPSLSSAASSSSSAVPRTMSHRIENPSIRPRHFQDQHFHDNHYYSAHPSPPPITTLTHSPSLSSDRSSVNSPAPTILPPLAHHPSQFQSQSYSASAAHRYPSAAQPGVYHHSHYYPNTISPPEVFTAPAPSYALGGYAPPPFHHATDMSMSPSQQYAVNPYATNGALYGGHGGGGSGGFTPIYTDDASTKLSDRVRRRCFNCCTTDTSTWRRSSLNPGKVLCNKCGLFERTHSRPRPEQFPHKRAPLQIPAQTGGALAAPAQQSAQSHIPAGSNSAPHNLPPTTGHPSLGTGYGNPSALPQIQEWLRPNSGSGANNHTGTGSSSASSSAGPSSRAHSASSAADNRHHPYASMSGPGSNSGAGATRSPQGHSARLAKRSNSDNSDFVDTPPPQHRTAQNLTPSPSPPPAETVQTSGTAVKEDSSERVSASHSAGTETSKA